ncbi:pectate lyase-like adhesive domain-containing protein, partial [Enterococcus larvae]|uniref:pectate lyase-like adhesive domain-containing protein n=1 Tax=Enterococcus larvae TaxID=2794352 RepID=UPI003F2FD464
MRIIKKNRIAWVAVTLILSIVLISKYLTIGNIKASEADYNLEIVDPNYKDTGYLQVKLSIPNTKKEKLKLNFSEVFSYDVEQLVDGLSDADQEKVAISVDDSDYLKGAELDLSGNGHALSITFVVLPDNESSKETGSVSLTDSAGNELSSISFETKEEEEIEEEPEVDQEAVDEITEAAADLQQSARMMISPMSIDLPTPTNPVDVTSWSELQTALTSPTVDWINLKADIDFGAAVTVTTSKVINGQNGAAKFTLNFAARAVTLGSASAGSKISLVNVDIKGTNAAAIFTSTTSNSANWGLELDNVATTENASALISAVEADVTISGETTLSNTGNTTFIIAKSLKVTDNANVTANIVRIFYSTARAGSQVTVDGDSKLTVTNSSTYNVIQATQLADFSFDGEGTEVTLNGYSTGGSSTDGVMYLDAGTSATTISVTNGAVLNVNSLATSSGAPCIMMESLGGKFIVSDNSELNAISENSDGGSLAAVVRFYTRGNNTFEASNNSKINLVKKTGNQSVLRMYRDNNGVVVSGGSEFNLTTAGDGTQRDPGSNGHNQGIQFRNGSSGATSYFKVLDEDSSVSMSAGYGATIDCNNQTLDVDVDEGAYFVVRGRTASATSGVFSSSSNVTNFTMNKPKYFDFRNDRTGGAVIFENNNGSTFNMTGSDLSVWKRGANLDGNPSKSWTMINSVWTGVNFAQGTSDNNSDFNSTFEGASAYSRMTANNQTAVIDELRVPTNADKYIWGHASVPEGKNEGMRDAYTDEVHVRVRVYRSSDPADYYEAVGSSIGDGEDDDGIAVYGDDERAGIFKIDVPNGEFLTAAYKIEVISAWRGIKENEGSSVVHTSTASDLQTPERVVLDVMPPEPTALTDENLNNATKVLSGENAESGALVHVYYNSGDSASGTLLGTTTVQSDGSWSFNLPYYVEKTKELSVYLSDTAGQYTAAQVVSAPGETPVLYDQTGLVKPPVTNISTGNINPYNDYAYHDAV